MGNNASNIEEKLRSSLQKDEPPDAQNSSTPERKHAQQTHENIAHMLWIYSKSQNVGDKIAKTALERYFCSEKDHSIGSVIFEYLALLDCTENKAGDKPDPIKVSKLAFLQMCNKIRELLTDTLQLRFYLGLFSSDQATLSKTELYNFFRSCFLLESELCGSRLDCDPNSPMLEKVINSITNSCLCKSDKSSIESIQSWCKKNIPGVQLNMHRWMFKKLNSVQEFSPEHKKATKTKSVPDAKELLHPAAKWLLWKTLPSLYTKHRRAKTPTTPRSPTGAMPMWDPHVIINNLLSSNTVVDWTMLYSGTDHGLSMNRFEHHVFSYRGPTMLVVQTNGDVMIAVGIDHEWRQRAQRWGGTDCIAIQITPVFKVLEAGDKMIYFNLNTRGYPFGLQIGQNPKCNILEIDQDMVMASVKKIPYQLAGMEVWGCAANDTRDEQLEQKKWENRQAERHKKINLNTVGWDENPDRYILELAGRPTYSKNFKR